jgi:hypothetical protein
MVQLPVDHGFKPQQFVEFFFLWQDKDDPSRRPFPDCSMVQTPVLRDRLPLIAGARNYARQELWQFDRSHNV